MSDGFSVKCSLESEAFHPLHYRYSIHWSSGWNLFYLFTHLLFSAWWMARSALYRGYGTIQTV